MGDKKDFSQNRPKTLSLWENPALAQSSPLAS
jgi:hypothetical protein